MAQEVKKVAHSPQGFKLWLLLEQDSEPQLIPGVYKCLQMDSPSWCVFMLHTQLNLETFAFILLCGVFADMLNNL